MSAEPQPNAAAILDTLNEIARELEDGAKKQPPESPGEMSIRLEKPGNRATGAVMPRVGMERLTEPVARPRSSGRRVVVGVFVALAYVAILAVAGLFISRAVNPVASGASGTSLGSQASAAITALVAKIDTVLHRRGGPAATDAVGSAAVSAPIEAPPRAEAVPLNPAVPPTPAVVESPRGDATETEISSPTAVPAPPAVMPKGADQATPAAQPAAAPAPPSVSDTPVVSAPPAAVPAARVETAAPSTPASPTPAAEPQHAAAAETAPPAAAIAPPAPAKDASAPVDPAAGQALRVLGDDRLRQGDIASARLFYERAADAGNARAALMMGGTYDSSFLERLGVLGMQGDPAQAALWYRRARELGEPEADTRLQTLPQK